MATNTTWESGPASLSSSGKLKSILCTLLMIGTELEPDVAQQGMARD